MMPSAIDGQGSAEGLQAQEVCKASRNIFVQESKSHVF